MHGDLKSANVLIVGDFEGVKLCDFGVTIPVNSEGKISDPNSQYVGTEAWSPMEVRRIRIREC
jgi:PDZ-binding kinase